MDYNRVILIGRMANDPELKYTPSGIPVTQFRLAVNRPMSVEARQSGQEKQADFISVVAWRQSAEFATNYLHKGRLVLVEGRLQVREYTTQDGQKRRESEVVVDNLKSLDRAKDAGDGGGAYRTQPDEYGTDNGTRTQTAPAAPAAPRRPATSPMSTCHSAPPPMDDDMDDPFADN
ncbi:MAG: single-stranded DNA-binding protein [Capsulimonadaceae bacterium]